MKRTFLLLINIIISVAAFSQDIVKLGDSLLDADDMKDARFILVNGGMNIEMSDKIVIDLNKQIIASNGSNIACIVNADKNDNCVTSVTFICESMADGLENDLRQSGYKFTANKTDNREYQNGNKRCKISHQTLNGVKTIQIEFSISHNQEQEII